MALRRAFNRTRDSEKRVLSVVPAGFLQTACVATAIGGVERGDNVTLIGNRQAASIERRELTNRAIGRCSSQVLAVRGVAEIVADVAAVCAD